MPIPLIACAIAGIAALWMNGCDSEEESAGTPVNTQKPQSDNTPPQVYYGDGVHTLRPADAVEANNGIRLTVDFKKREKGLQFYSMYQDEFFLIPTVGNDPIMITPYPYAIMVTKEGYPEIGCADIMDLVRISQIKGETGDTPKITLQITSLSNSHLSSRKEAAEQCLSNGGPYEQCCDAVPWEAFQDEVLYHDDIFYVQVPDDTEDWNASKKLQQLERCFDRVTTYMDFTPPLDKIGYRVINEVWPNTGKSIQGQKDDLTMTVCHEMAHLNMYNITMPIWMAEGLAQYFQENLISDMVDIEPWDIYKEFKAEAGTYVSDPGFTVSSVDPVNKKILVSVDDPIEDNMEVPVPGAFEANGKYVVAESIDNEQVFLKTYYAGNISNFPPTKTVCMENSAVTYAALPVDGVQSVIWVSSLMPPYEFPYENTGQGMYEKYSGGLCFWSEFVERFGEDKFKQLLTALDNIRNQNVEGGEKPFCIADIMHDLVGEGVYNLLNKFGVEDFDNLCMPAVFSLELVSLTGPSGDNSCEWGTTIY